MVGKEDLALVRVSREPAASRVPQLRRGFVDRCLVGLQIDQLEANPEPSKIRNTCSKEALPLSDSREARVDFDTPNALASPRWDSRRRRRASRRASPICSTRREGVVMGESALPAITDPRPSTLLWMVGTWAGGLWTCS